MTVREFAALIARNEGLKKQVNIAQISEILKVIRTKIKQGVGFDLYGLVRKI